MKLSGKQVQKIRQSLLFCFVILFSANFMYQRIVDNEINCGSLGSPEGGCPYSFLDHTFGTNPGHDLGEEGDHSDHVCLSCPCNSLLSITWNLYLSHILIQLHKIYFEPAEIQFSNFVIATFLFRPPKQHLT